MLSIFKGYKQIEKDYWDYAATLAHSKNARKAEKRRAEMINTISGEIKNVSKISDFEGDKSMRDSVVAYLKITKKVLNEDFSNIVNLEEVAEQSYDAMEAYILAREIANKKLDLAGEVVSKTQKIFAEKHNINLVENKTELQKKIEKANDVFHYQNIVYLIFFKSFKQDTYLSVAHQSGNVVEIEKQNQILISDATLGLAKLDTMKSFKNDPSLVNSCKKMLQFFIKESSKTVDIMLFLNKKEKFEELRNKGAKTNEEITSFNAAVLDYNNSLVKYNTLNEQLYNEKNQLLEKWNNTMQQFLDKHVPQKK